MKKGPEDKAVFAATDIRYRNKSNGKVTATPRPVGTSDLRSIITKKRQEKSSQPMMGDHGDKDTRSIPGTSGSKVIQVHNTTFTNCTVQLTTN